MRNIILAVLIAVGVAGAAGQVGAKDQDGLSNASPFTCAMYLEAYSKSTLDGVAQFTGPQGATLLFGWAKGFEDGINAAARNGKRSVNNMTPNDTRKWLASWCRDNPSKVMVEAFYALIPKSDR